MTEFDRNVVQIIKMIPSGRVASYGQIAELAGFKNYARHVGKVLARAPEELQLPWHRVVNAQGKISHRGTPGSIELQRLLLEEEGVEIGLKGKISMAQYRWEPSA